jgi:DNA-directed RNA polymerase subunit RPC12/RpoP
VPQPLHTGRMVLTPEDPYRLPEDLHAVIDELSGIGFIASPLPGHSAAFLLGENFMQWVTFMGCSPFIRLEPGDDGEPFCHLVIDGPYERPRLLQGRNTAPPRCAACRKRIDIWHEVIGGRSREAADGLAVCPHCGHRQDPATYDWRQSAGCGRLFLQVENIFPQEAVPSPGLLERLGSASGGLPWRHFYLQDPTAVTDLDAAAT